MSCSAIHTPEVLIKNVKRHYSNQLRHLLLKMDGPQPSHSLGFEMRALSYLARNRLMQDFSPQACYVKKPGLAIVTSGGGHE